MVSLSYILKDNKRYWQDPITKRLYIDDVSQALAERRAESISAVKLGPIEEYINWSPPAEVVMPVQKFNPFPSIVSFFSGVCRRNSGWAECCRGYL